MKRQLTAHSNCLSYKLSATSYYLAPEVRVADSIRKRIMAAVDTRLKTILMANGYATNAGQHIYEWLTQNLEITSLPAIAYKDTGDTGGEVVVIAGPTDSIREYAIDVDFELLAQGSTVRAVIRDMIADLILAVGVDPTWGGLALYTDLSGDDTEIEQHENTIGLCKVKINITYRTKVWDQTSQ